MHKQPMFTEPVRAQVGAVAALVAAGLFLAGAVASATDQQAVATTTTTDAATAAAAPTFSDPDNIDNRYLPLTATKECVMRGRTVEGETERTVRTVLKRRKTFTIGDQEVRTVVIRDKAYEGGKLVETTLDYYAQGDDGTVYYVGEQVKNLRNGKVVNTNGTWLYGKDTDRLGVAMPPEPVVGQQWRFEDVPGVTMESNRLEETGLRTKVGKRVRTDVIRVQEFIQPEGEIEYKLYASGIGLVAEYAPDARSFYAGCS